MNQEMSEQARNWSTFPRDLIELISRLVGSGRDFQSLSLTSKRFSLILRGLSQEYRFRNLFVKERNSVAFNAEHGKVSIQHFSRLPSGQPHGQQKQYIVMLPVQKSHKPPTPSTEKYRKMVEFCVKKKSKKGRKTMFNDKNKQIIALLGGEETYNERIRYFNNGQPCGTWETWSYQIAMREGNYVLCPYWRTSVTKYDDAGKPEDEKFFDQLGLKSHTTWKDGKLHGLKSCRWEVGGTYVWAESPYCEGRLHGDDVTWEISARLRNVTSWTHGVSGDRRKYTMDGRLVALTSRKNGKMDGLDQNWHENGQLKSSVMWKDEKKQGLYEEFHSSGILVFSVNYLDNHWHGPYQTWDGASGIRTTVRFYQNNKKQGTSYHYHPTSGLLISTSNHNNGIACGEKRKFDAETGEKIWSCPYLDGRKHGKEVEWTSENEIQRTTWVNGGRTYFEIWDMEVRKLSYRVEYQKIDGVTRKHEVRWEKGIKVLQRSWLEDEKHGEEYEWDNTGRLLSLATYDHGEKIKNTWRKDTRPKALAY